MRPVRMMVAMVNRKNAKGIDEISEILNFVAPKVVAKRNAAKIMANRALNIKNLILQGL